MELSHWRDHYRLDQSLNQDSNETILDLQIARYYLLGCGSYKLVWSTDRESDIGGRRIGGVAVVWKLAKGAKVAITTYTLLQVWWVGLLLFIVGVLGSTSAALIVR